MVNGSLYCIVCVVSSYAADLTELSLIFSVEQRSDNVAQNVGFYNVVAPFLCTPVGQSWAR